PDVVFEGGNAALSPGGDVELPDSLSLLTTNYRTLGKLLTTFGDTSGASALAARMTTRLQRRYRDFWPETIRALIVHSASWTEAMLDRYGPLKLKADWENLVRRCGFGVPSLERALWSADNRLTLVAQESLQPFIRKTGATSTTLKELQIYELPWPIQDLRDLGNETVELRVTLSYFVEPNPSERGYQYRHRYSSHGFRFDVRGAEENLDDFRKRLNKAVSLSPVVDGSGGRADQVW
ncbi:MAG: S8 family serine peptidase, partial [bacterium]|nr:S8 family serine peptidase [bacterium]